VFLPHGSGNEDAILAFVAPINDRKIIDDAWHPSLSRLALKLRFEHAIF